MKDWICDANINEATVKKFEEVAGIKVAHVVKDYGITDQREDDEIIAFAKKENKTLITGNYTDFNSKSNVQYVNSPGVWIFKTHDPDKQALLLKKTREKAKLKTLASRKNKKVYIKNDNTVDITNVKTGKKISLKLDGNEKAKNKKRKSRKKGE
ncbi:MAG: DUF5615 family PIN-like protein [Candidatus Roizmanbacteria bacterium]|nr:DUF5615 family PIN-like protein [Candidatus Roizmanbacteria bacterium]